MTNSDIRGHSERLSLPGGSSQQREKSPFELRLDQLLTPFSNDKPGLAALVTVGGKLVFERYLGCAVVEDGAPVTASTGFHVASTSKPFTALAVLLEADAGRVDLDADVHDYLPELADYGERMTILDLVHHTAGLRDVADLLALCGTGLDGVIRQSLIVALALRQKALNFPPGTRYHYSNTGYSLLAEVIARTSGTSLGRYLKEIVFGPLGMHDTLVYDNGALLLPAEARSYRLNARGEPRLVRFNNSSYGARGVYTTARDLAKFARELLHPNQFRPELIARMTSPGRLRDGTPLNYGFGLLREVLAGRPALQHSGGDQGYRAAFQCFPDDDASVIVLSNGQADVGAIAEALADVFLTPRPLTPEPPTPDAATLRELAGYYVSGTVPSLKLEVKGGKLMASTGGAPIEAKFLANGNFYLLTPTYRISRGPGGDLIESQGVGASELVHRRATRVEPSAGNLAAISGTYRSEEIDSTYELAATDRGLTLSCLRFPPLSLAPADTDAFDGPGLRLTIVRDGDGAPTGCRVSTFRAWGVWFQKIA